MLSRPFAVPSIVVLMDAVSWRIGGHRNALLYIGQSIGETVDNFAVTDERCFEAWLIKLLAELADRLLHTRLIGAVHWRGGDLL